ncbi:MAG: TrkA family potassium uptake protein [Ardenticatenales bacterium]
MHVLIAGGGRTAEHLGTLLLSQDHTVHLIEPRKSVLARLHKALPTEMIFEGDPTDPDVLELAGIRDAEVLAAVGGGDADNLALCYMARKRYGTDRTIARINNPQASWLFARKELFGVDVALNQPELLASLIEEEMSLGDMMTLLRLHRGQFSLVEEKLPPDAPVVGRALRDLALPDQSVVAVIIRDHQMVIPHGDTILQPEDEVLAICKADVVSLLAAQFSRPERSAPLVTKTPSKKSKPANATPE